MYYPRTKHEGESLHFGLNSGYAFMPPHFFARRVAHAGRVARAPLPIQEWKQYPHCLPPLRLSNLIGVKRSTKTWTCSESRRRRNVGVPKGIDLGVPFQQLTADECPWDDYLVPELCGNSRVKDASKYTLPNEFKVLGVESSCDDTAAAVVCSDGRVLSDCRVSQGQLTEEWGGIVPHVARDAHANVIEHVIAGALEEAQLSAEELDAVAVTMGPGLEICLRVGYRAARDIAKEYKKEFVAVNHLEAHVLVARKGSNVGNVEFPFVTLLVSGGHCQLLLAHDVAQYEVLGGTLDDAPGEAYDKTARLLGLEVGVGGGPALEKLALEGNIEAIPFPVPMQKRADCNFSFAGLKTGMRMAIEKLGGIEHVRNDRRIMADLAASFQETAVRHLEQRVSRALQLCDRHGSGAKTLVVSGGVAANQVVRRRLQGVCEKHSWECVIPDMKLCTDNGVMVGWAGIERLRLGIADDHENLDVRARWPLAGLGNLATQMGKEVLR